MRAMKKWLWASLFFLALVFPGVVSAAGKASHVVLIVWDGMRPDFISRKHTPTLYQLSRHGVRFENHHAVYCAATEVNGTALATGAYPEHSGVIANRDYRPELNVVRPVDTQSLGVIRKGDELTGGHYLLRPTFEETLQRAGKKTVIAGTKPVVLLHDRSDRADDFNQGTVVYEGKALPATALRSVAEELGKFPAAASTSSSLPNEARDQWTTRALLRSLWSNSVPEFSLLWLSEPDFSQHAAGPGSGKALAAIKSADQRLAEVLAELDRRGVRGQTDVFVVSDHGFSTVEKSVNVGRTLRDAGFNARSEFRRPPKPGDILVVGQGGSVLFYVAGHDEATIRRLVEFLHQQDFCGVSFTRERMAGTFTLGQAMVDSPHAPDVMISMHWSEKKSKTGARGLLFSEGSRKPGEGSHASLSRYELHNMLVGSGPDLKQDFIDSLPTGNIDLAPTILWLLGVSPTEPMDGRILSEALTVEGPPVGRPTTERLERTLTREHSIWHQYLLMTRINQTTYLDEGNGGITTGAD